jgi:hypothetical protein
MFFRPTNPDFFAFEAGNRTIVFILFYLFIYYLFIYLLFIF